MNEYKINHLTKTFKDTVALNNINITIGGNKIYGLLGRNGAGKTTLLNLMTGRIFPTSGSVTIDNLDVIKNDISGKVYFMSQTNTFVDGIRCKKALKLTSDFYPNFDMQYAIDLAKKFSLDINKKVTSLSTGYLSIFKIILALSSNAEFLLFDEPVLGLDANHRELFYKELIESYDNVPKTIIISTHLIDEAANLFEDVLILKNHEVLINTSLSEISENSYTVSGSCENVKRYIEGKNVIGYDILGNYQSAYIMNDEKDTKLASSLGLDISSIDLQKLFIKLTNN